MGLPSGFSIPLSPSRRIMEDTMHFSRQVPLVSLERRMRLRSLVESRARLPVRPSWFAIFVKAFALVAQQRPALRQSYLSLPWRRLYQHPCSVAHIAVARKIGDEDVVLPLQIRYPERRSLAEIDRRIRAARVEPAEKIGDYRRMLRFARLPGFLRRMMGWLTLNLSGNWRLQYFGSFGVTGVAALGSTSLHVLSPLTSTLAYGVLEDDGSMLVRFYYDHRVMDGIEPASAMADLEQTLLGPIAAELSQSQRQAA